jgi:hypothetical protein
LRGELGRHGPSPCEGFAFIPRVQSLLFACAGAEFLKKLWLGPQCGGSIENWRFSRLLDTALFNLFCLKSAFCIVEPQHPQDYNSSDIEFEPCPNPCGRGDTTGQASIDEIIARASEFRKSSKKTVKQLEFNTGAPSTRDSQEPTAATYHLHNLCVMSVALNMEKLEPKQSNGLVSRSL